jgi:hypothetical protein
MLMKLYLRSNSHASTACFLYWFALFQNPKICSYFFFHEINIFSNRMCASNGINICSYWMEICFHGQIYIKMNLHILVICTNTMLLCMQAPPLTNPILSVYCVCFHTIKCGILVLVLPICFLPVVVLLLSNWGMRPRGGSRASFIWGSC